MEARVPTGQIIRLPEKFQQDRPYFQPHELDQALAYYETEGYVVIRRLLPRLACEQVTLDQDPARFFRVLLENDFYYQLGRLQTLHVDVHE